MKKLTWWCRIVGGFNLLVGVSNLVFILASSKTLEDTLPYAQHADLGRAFGDAWFAFVMDSLVIGVALLWASRAPLKNVNLVWLVVALELFHGPVHEAFLVARGYDAVDYLPLLVIQFAIIGTGIAFARSAPETDTDTKLDATADRVDAGAALPV